MTIEPQHLMYLGNPMQLLLIVVVILILFGKGKVADFMGEFGKGIKSFKKGLADDDHPTPPQPTINQPKSLEQQAVRPEVQSPTTTETKV